MAKTYVVQFSGGAASYCAAKRAISRHGKENVVLLFCDTLTEDRDTYRFLNDAARHFRIMLNTIADGRDIWQVFKDERFLGNSKIDPCSKILKRELASKWMNRHYTPENAVRILGYSWDEQHRHDETSEACAPWICESPMLERPLMDKNEMLAEIRSDGIEPPILYSKGAPHNNCGGGCVKAGQAHWAWLLKTIPEEYAKWEANEEMMRQYLQKNVSIIKTARGAKVLGLKNRPLTLKEFRGWVECGAYDKNDYGACSCFAAPAHDTEIEP